MTQSKIVISSSSRINGNTEKIIERYFAEKGEEYTHVRLCEFNTAFFSYRGEYPESDQFPEIIHQILLHDEIYFATPVYWYSMSGLLKIFFDRLTDLITIDKTSGRKLKGKNCYLLATGTDPELPEGFLIPFQKTAGYFDMNFISAEYFQEPGF